MSAIEKRPPIDRISFTDVDCNPRQYAVGLQAVTRIIETTENGEYALVPYVEIYDVDGLRARFSQHKLDGIFYSKEPTC